MNEDVFLTLYGFFGCVWLCMVEDNLWQEFEIKHGIQNRGGVCHHQVWSRCDMPRYTCESPLLLGGFKRLDFVRLTQLFPMHDIESSSHFVTCDSYVRNKGNTMSKSSYCEMVIEKSCLKSLGPRIWGGIVINHEIPRNCIEIVHFGILNKSTRILKVGET